MFYVLKLSLGFLEFEGLICMFFFNLLWKFDQNLMPLIRAHIEKGVVMSRV